MFDYKNDWIIDSGCSNHMTGDDSKLLGMNKYIGDQVIVIVDNTKLRKDNVGKRQLPKDAEMKKYNLRMSIMSNG